MDIIQLSFDSPKLCECGCGEFAPIATRNRPEWGYSKGEQTRFVLNHSLRKRTPIEVRFWRNVNKTSGCWLWTGTLSPKGYGNIGLGGRGGKHSGAHRVSWELHYGPIPEGLFVLHRCDVPACVNPEHLWLGTNRDNIDDMMAKGRSASGDNSGARKHPDRVPRGSKHCQAKLTEVKVSEMRTLYSYGTVTLDCLAKQFGISLATCFEVIHHKTWKHVP